MRNFTLLIVLVVACLGCGIAYGFVLADAPRLEKKLKLEKQLKQTQQEAEEYRKRCVAWSQYVWKLESN